MLSCEKVRELFSGYYDGACEPGERAEVSAHFSRCVECPSEYSEFVRTLDIVHAIPAEEPSLDLWPEFSRRMDEIAAAERGSVPLRIRRRWDEALSSLSEGAILYTTTVAERTAHRLAKYLMRDPFAAED